MSDERPEALLRSALEKIVYFEARSKQLENDVASAMAEGEQLKRELTAAAQREIELRRSVAGLEVELQRSHRERDELARMLEALRSERSGLLGQLIDAARIQASDSTEEQTQLDLASFIAQLRSEAFEARVQAPAAAQVQTGAPAAAQTQTPTADQVQPQAQAPVWARAQTAAPVSAPASAWAQAQAAAQVSAPAPAPALAMAVARTSGVAAHAERLRAQGRLGVSAEDLARLSGAVAFPGRTEETLFGFSVRELQAPDAPARARAAERLRALGQAAAAPVLATALHGEQEPKVQVALLNAFSELASSEGTAIVLPLLDAPAAEVRISALKALLALDPTQAGPHLSAAMKDADRAVRRRASLLALGLSGEAALALGEEALRDSDLEVRSLGALVLGAGGGERARTLLLGALRDPEKKVRKAAAQSLSRILGEDVSPVVELDEPQRRREVRRLSGLPAHPVQAALRAKAPARRALPVAAPAAVSAVAAMPAAAPVAPIVPPPRPQPSVEPLCAALANELRISIRGRSVAELASISNQPQPSVVEACELLVARGKAVRRGTKFFAA